MKLGFLFFSCAALLLGGCDHSTLEEKRGDFNENWGPEVTFKDEHLFVNWANIEGVKGALSLKIPQEYLDSQIAGEDDKGKVDRLYFELMLPNGGPLPQILESMNGPEEERNQMKEMAANRVFVVLYRDYLSQTSESIHRRKYKVSGSGPNVFLDGEVSGLEKYSAMICASDHTTSPPDYKAMVQKNLAAKTVDDLSPPGCYKNARHFILVTPEKAKQADITFASCWNDTCWVHFNIANRTAELTVGMADVLLLRERVDVSRRVIGGFAVFRNP